MKNLFIGVLLIIGQASFAQTNDTPFKMKSNLFDQSQLEDLGLKSPKEVKTFVVYAATDSTDKYVNGAVVVAFKGKLYCQWQSSLKDEDSHDTWVAYSSSVDGKRWSQPKVLAESSDNGYCTSGGWLVNGDTLTAFINQWTYEEKPRYSKVMYKSSVDGMNWTIAKPVKMKDGTDIVGAFEQDPHVLPNGRIVGALHRSPGLHVTPIYTDDISGTTGWCRGNMENMPYEGDVTREIEPSCFWRKNGDVVMVFRDQKSSYRKLASISKDNGETWTTPVITNMLDSRSKQSAGNLPDGAVYFASNPIDGKTRWPLVLTLSKKGYNFNRAFVLQKESDLPELKFEGRYKRKGFHYPKSMVSDGYLYVAYTVNKEIVKITKVPLASIE